METSKSYFFQAFLILIFATIFFFGLKKILPNKIFDTSKITSKNVVVDSMLIEAFESQDKLLDQIVDKEDEKIISENYNQKSQLFPVEGFEDYKGYDFIISFYEKLYQLEHNPDQKIRIAYFGDSMTDGDMIVEDFRSFLQNKFGGTGVGYVPVTSESSSSRSSIEHQYSPNWKTKHFVNSKANFFNFGVSGSVSILKDSTDLAWVKFKSSNKSQLEIIDQASVFYGKSNNSKGKIKLIQGADTILQKLNPVKKLNFQKLTQKPLKSLKANFYQADSIPVYGFNFDSNSGIHVDNFSQRGNSGIPLTKLDETLMQEFHKILQYDLIILHYGTNVLNYGTKNYRWYENSMTKTVNHLKKCFPDAEILIVSTADKGTKYDTEMRTDSAVVPLTRSQKRYAIATQSAFIDLFSLMGGEGTIVKWTEEEPNLANKDYTHLNFRGAKKVANILYSEIYKGYEFYKQNRNSFTKNSTGKLKNSKTDSIQSNRN